ncbi:MAG: glucose-6-phosphate isomerase, partial [Opitutae bacterium]
MSWDRFKRYYLEVQDMDFSIDISRMNFEDDFLEKMEPKAFKAIEDMKALENGAIANPDEKRMVGHYWLRNPELAPTETIASEIRSTITAIKDFSAKVHSGKIRGSDGAFKNLLVIGIGG